MRGLPRPTFALTPTTRASFNSSLSTSCATASVASRDVPRGVCISTKNIGFSDIGNKLNPMAGTSPRLTKKNSAVKDKAVRG